MLFLADTGCNTDLLGSCAVLSPPMCVLDLLLTEKTMNVTTPNCCCAITWLEERVRETGPELFLSELLRRA